MHRTKTKVVFFGHNRKDAAIQRRIHSFLDAGIDVTGFMFRRDGEPKEPGPAWKNIDLGMVEHCQHAQRIFTLMRAIWRSVTHRSIIRKADIVYARNFDMLILAFVSLIFMYKDRPKVVYECLDVNQAMTKSGAAGATIRWFERVAMRHIDLLVVSSPGFINNYFVPMQHYHGPHALIENKIYFPGEVVARPIENTLKDSTKGPLVIAWVGILRCQVSLDLLKQLAQSEGNKVLIRFHGLISDYVISDFEEQIEPFPNIVYKGPYEWPKGLTEAYSGVHLIWAQELHWSGFNSDWLLPNRIYEGSYFGALSLCVNGTETSKAVQNRGLGYVLPDSKSQTLIDFVRDLDRKEVLQKQKALLNRPISDFVASADEVKDLVERVLPFCGGEPTSSKLHEVSLKE
jgi:succinoglycan biosynthesis protein ExoL